MSHPDHENTSAMEVDSPLLKKNKTELMSEDKNESNALANLL